MNPNYNPDFFKPKDIEHAKRIILTREDTTTEKRWELETAWQTKVLGALTNINRDSCVLDWGCGIGRLSKSIIKEYNCSVYGVDIQQQMLEYAGDYVNDEKFTPILYQNIEEIKRRKYSHIISVWVLQHSINVKNEIKIMHECLEDAGRILIVENHKKVIPDHNYYYDDGVSVMECLKEYFEPEVIGKLPEAFTSPALIKSSWWALLRKK